MPRGDLRNVRDQGPRRSARSSRLHLDAIGAGRQQHDDGLPLTRVVRRTCSGSVKLLWRRGLMASQYLEVHQTRRREPTPFEVKLAGAIEEIFGRGVHDISGMLGELNASGLAAPDGAPWTEDSLMRE